MQIFEIRFKLDLESRQFSHKKFSTLLDDFLFHCAKCGLILEGGMYSYTDAGYYICRVIAQDGDAISEHNMNYDAADALKSLLSLCDGLPQLVPCEELTSVPHCTCEKPSYYILESCAEWEGSGIKCGDCKRNVVLYRLNPIAVDRDFSELLKWKRLHRSFMMQHKLGYNTMFAYTMLSDCVSDLNLLGRDIAGRIERMSDITTLYPLYSGFDEVPGKCPQCGGSWINQYRDAVPYRYFCRACRIVT